MNLCMDYLFPRSFLDCRLRSFIWLHFSYYCSPDCNFCEKNIWDSPFGNYDRVHLGDTPDTWRVRCIHWSTVFRQNRKLRRRILIDVIAFGGRVASHNSYQGESFIKTSQTAVIRENYLSWRNLGEKIKIRVITTRNKVAMIPKAAGALNTSARTPRGNIPRGIKPNANKLKLMTLPR